MELDITLIRWISLHAKITLTENNRIGRLLQATIVALLTHTDGRGLARLLPPLAYAICLTGRREGRSSGGGLGGAVEGVRERERSREGVRERDELGIDKWNQG